MNNSENIKEKPEVVIAEEVANDISQNDEDTIESMIPSMNLSVPENGVPKENHLISDEKYLEVIDEIMTNMREDRKEVTNFIDTFSNMVINDGDATTSTKEALVNLIKTKVKKITIH